MQAVDVTPDPKPRKRIVDHGARERKLLSEPRCRLCGKAGKITKIGDRKYIAGLSAHHLVKRSQGGDDVEANLMPLCGHGTSGCHGEVEANMIWVRVLVRSNMTQEELGYCVARKGAEWLERRYPRLIGGSSVVDVDRPVM